MNYLFCKFSYLNEEGLTTKYVAVTAAAKIGRPGAAKRRGEEGGGAGGSATMLSAEAVRKLV